MGSSSRNITVDGKSIDGDVYLEDRRERMKALTRRILGGCMNRF